jgi:hypothetical protein
MQFQTILFLLGIGLVVGTFVARPFIQTNRSIPTADHVESALLAERERLLVSLRELDFDHELGKVPEDDYLEQRFELVRLGAEVMEKLDALQKAPAPKLLPVKKKLDVQATDDDVENLIAKRRSASRELAEGFCPNCGKAVLASDRFCPGCGNVLH